MARKRSAYTRQRDRLRIRPKTPAPTTGWLKPELVRLTQVSGRRITEYVRQGLLPSPEFRGTATRYQRVHLIRLLAIERFLGMRVRRLNDIRRRMNALTFADLEAWVRSVPLRPDVLQALDAGAVTAADVQQAPRADNTQHAATTTTHFPSQSWYRVEVLPGFELALRSDASPLTKRVASRVLAKLERAVTRATEDLAPVTSTSE